MKKIGILGGSFDPVHCGHLLLSRAVAEACKFDQIMLMPASKAPHKKQGTFATATERLNMLQLAIRNDPLFQINTLELDRGAVSYTIDTLRALRADHPDNAYYFIIGMDSLLELHSWKQILDLLNLCTFVTVARSGVNHPLNIDDLMLPKPQAQKLLDNIIKTPVWEISSSNIRERIAKRLSIRYLVPEAVEDYILKTGVYSC